MVGVPLENIPEPFEVQVRLFALLTFVLFIVKSGIGCVGIKQTAPLSPANPVGIGVIVTVTCSMIVSELSQPSLGVKIAFSIVVSIVVEVVATSCVNVGFKLFIFDNVPGPENTLHVMVSKFSAVLDNVILGLSTQTEMFC